MTKFKSTVSWLIEQNRWLDIYPLVCALLLCQKLPYDTRQSLKHLLLSEAMPELKSLTQQVFLKKVVAKYLKTKQVSRAKNYDEKGYKVI